MTSPILRPTQAEWDEAITAQLAELGLTFDGLARQAITGDFDPPEARMLWLMVKPDRELLEGIQYGLYWRHGNQWRHNTRRDQLTDIELAGLARWAVCEPGGTAHLTREGWELLDGPEAVSTPGEPGSEPSVALSPASEPTDRVRARMDRYRRPEQR